jgi:hypothetical protein
MFMADGDSSKRQVAYKVRISDILDNRFVREEGWLPNYVAVGDKKVSRVNLIGVVVSREIRSDDASSQNFIIDDGTGRIALRFMGEGTILDVGDIVNIIGRPREFGADRFIVQESVRKISDSRWVKVRQLEIALSMQSNAPSSPASEDLMVETEDFVDDSNPSVRIVNLIRELDAGSGAGFDEIAVKFKGGSPDEFIKRLLESGDVFEVKPGRYKVLE